MLKRTLFITATLLCLGGAATAQVVDYDVDANARAVCAAEWVNDFAMQAYCLGNMEDGYNEFALKYEALDASHPLVPAADNCMQDWFDGASRSHDWRMVNYCYGNQEDAYNSLNPN